MSKTIILAPHYDDAVFSCFNLLEDENTLVLNVFTGIPDKKKISLWDFICGEAKSYKMMQIRNTENSSIFNSLPCSYIDLGYLENQYRKNIDRNDVINSIMKHYVKADLILAPIAMGRFYSHPDHKLLRDIAISLNLEKGVKIGFYYDLPYISSSHKDKKIIRKLSKLTSLEMHSIVTKFSSSQIAKKIDMSKSYKSQYFPTNLVSLGALRRNILKGIEILVITK